MSFLNLENKKFLITGVANRKSIAFHVVKTLLGEGAKIVLTVQNTQIMEKVEKLLPDCPLYLLDVENDDSYTELASALEKDGHRFDGILHSIAFANYSEGMKPIHEVKWEDFSQATKISCYSLPKLVGSSLNLINDGGSVVAMSISNTRATNYGFMGPIKAALDSAVAFTAKGLSEKQIRCNAVCAGPLKTSASAGIPGYVDNYLFAEQLTLRKKALETSEVANTVSFLLSPSSSGINAAGLIVDAGMSCNYFEESVVNKAMS